MDDEVLTRVIGLVILLFLIIGFAALIRKNLKVEVKELEPKKENLCLLCGRLATENWAFVTTSKLDQDVSRHKRLHGLGAMHIHTDSAGFEPVLCTTHKRMILRKWEQIFSDITSRRLKLEVTIEEEIAKLESGAMLDWAKQEVLK